MQFRGKWVLFGVRSTPNNTHPPTKCVSPKKVNGEMKKQKRNRGCLNILLIFAALLLALVGFLYWDNHALPAASPVLERLSAADQARLAEAIHLRQSLGDAVMPGLKGTPGFGAADIPVLAFNERYAFLVGLPEPAAGWRSVPQGEQFGVAWQPVPDETFQGQVYYRQELDTSLDTTQNFAVQIGDRYTASLTTGDFAPIGLANEIRSELPPVLSDLLPLRLYTGILLRGADGYTSLLAHESFHAYAGSMAPEKLAQAEQASRSQDHYPWEEQPLIDAWQEELDLLSMGAEAAWGEATEAEVLELAQRFLAQRQNRYLTMGLSPELIAYEQQREWVEGLARYAELDIWRQAYLDKDYQPLPEALALDDFDAYQGFPQRLAQEIDQIPRMASNEGDGRFYYTGFAQAALLDRLLPGWKERVMQEGIWLDDLLEEAAGG